MPDSQTLDSRRAVATRGALAEALVIGHPEGAGAGVRAFFWWPPFGGDMTSAVVMSHPTD
jgi:hypothetical protein